MTNINLLYESITFIENHLKEKLSVKEMAEHIGYSQFHYSRIFTKSTGYSPYDYYRGRKITETLEYMNNKQLKIIDAAIEYGFSSPESFARACISVFKQSPSTIRKQLATNQFVGMKKITLEYLYFIEQQEHLNFKVITMPPLTLSGIGYISPNDEDIFKIPTELIEHLKYMMDKNTSTVYKLNIRSTNNRHQGVRFIGFNNIKKSDEYSQFLVKEIPESTYLAVKLTDHTNDFLLLNRYINHYYLPQNSYKRTYPFELEAIHYNKLNNSRLEGILYIPISKT